MSTAINIKKKLGTILLAGALATGGLVATSVAAAPAAEAAVCGSTSQWNGYAYANNGCGYAQAVVGRYVNGKYQYVSATVYKAATSVSWTAGSRWYEQTSRW